MRVDMISVFDEILSVTRQSEILQVDCSNPESRSSSRVVFSARKWSRRILGLYQNVELGLWLVSAVLCRS